MRQVEPGFARPEEVQTFRLAIPERLISDDQQAARTLRAHRASASQQVPGVTSVGLSSSITMDGEDNGNPLYVEGVPVPDGTLPPLSALQERRSRVLRDDGQPPGGRALDHVDRDLPAPARDPPVRNPRARVLAGAREGARQAGARLPRRGVAGNRRRGRRRARRRPEPSGDGHRVLADAERQLSAPDDGLRRAVDQRRHAGLPARAPAGSLVRQPESAAGRRPDADRDPCPFDGADIVCDGDAGDCRERRAAPRRRRDLRRDCLHCDAADARDRHPHGARRTDRATCGSCSCVRGSG